MTTTPITVMMTETEAKQITTRIELRLETIASNSEAVVELIEQAKAGSAHEVLGYPSWTAYVSDKFGGTLARLQKAERVPIVEMLAETGMSVRAIASVTNTSKSTIDREVSQVGTPAAGLDGKTYARNGRPTSTGVVEMAEAVPAPSRRAPRRSPLPDQFTPSVAKLYLAATKLERLMQDDRFGANRKAIKDRHGNEIDLVHSILIDLLRAMEED